VASERADERRQNDRARVDEQLGDLTGASNVFVAVPVIETQVAGEPMPEIVSVQDKGLAAAFEKTLLDRIGQRRFPCA
jgi:hypothetical protein